MRSCRRTLNLTDRDPKCDLDYIPHGGRELTVDYVLSNFLRIRRHQRHVDLWAPAGDSPRTTHLHLDRDGPERATKDGVN